MTVLKEDLRNELAHLCTQSDTVQLNSNFVLNLMEYVSKLEAVAWAADEAVPSLKDTCPGKAESLANKVHRAILACAIVNTCKPQRQQS